MADQADARHLFTHEARTWELKDWKASHDTRAELSVVDGLLVVRIAVEPVAERKGYLFERTLGHEARSRVGQLAVRYPLIYVGLVPNSDVLRLVAEAVNSGSPHAARKLIAALAPTESLRQP